MTRSLQKIGNSKGLILTRDMLQHLGVTDEVEIAFEAGRIVLTAPVASAPRRRETFEEAADAVFEQYDETLRRLVRDAGD
ncbi:MAG: AbrB/MazE/SpoVT family DNA-binding domain-containing protein [Capsulimonas sp.]|uniref:AbrB/MazE/SpoVT family DNA-binding domain-containing protein n=1 Tax=Capsulimonas sp. TaxID=2494211 RepID=UPI0032633D54